MNRRTRLAGLLAGISLLVLAPSPSVAQPARQVTWTVTNEGSRPLRVTCARGLFMRSARIPAGARGSLELPAGIYDVKFSPEGGSAERRRIDLRGWGELQTRFSGATDVRDDRLDAAPLDEVVRLAPPRVRRRSKRRRPPNHRSWRGLLTIEAFGGFAFTAPGEVEYVAVSTPLLGLGESEEHTVESVDVPADEAPVFGLRLGLGGEVGDFGSDKALVLGGAVEWSRFAAAGGPVRRWDIDAIALLFTGRVLIHRDAEHPLGRLQLTGGIGFGIYLSDVEVEAPGVRSAEVGELPTIDEQSVDAGFELRLGATLPLFGPLALFVEYRLSVIASSIHLRDLPPPWINLFGHVRDLYADRTIVTNHLVAGLSLQF